MSEKNPWKTTSSEIVYKNDWIRVREDQVIRPDGNPGIYGVVEARIATGVVALNTDGEIYLVGQYRYTLDQYSWEIVEGGAEPGEDPLSAVKRELAEETGLSASQWQPLGGKIHLSNCHSSETAYLYLAQELSEGTANPEGTEQLIVRCVPLDEAEDMVASAQITDAMSIIGIQRAAHLLSHSHLSQASS